MSLAAEVLPRFDARMREARRRWQRDLAPCVHFQYTKNRTTFAGADEPNLEQKGVALDVRVPVTEESVRLRSAGGDPVLEAAVELLKRETQ